MPLIQCIMHNYFVHKSIFLILYFMLLILYFLLTKNYRHMIGIGIRFP